MVETRSWQEMQDWVADMLEARTGAGVAEWNRRIEGAGPFEDGNSLRAWLDREDVHGYPQGMLVMEQFGYPDFLVATSEQLIDAQYADRPALRPIYDAIVARLPEVGDDAAVQTRKNRCVPGGAEAHLRRGPGNHSHQSGPGSSAPGRGGGPLDPGHADRQREMPVRIALTSADEVDDEVVDFMARSYQENA